MYQFIDTSPKITPADVPVELRERYLGANGEFLVRAFAKESLWDYAALKQAVDSGKVKAESG